MANQFLGEVSAEANGQAFTLRLDFNTLCTLEEVTGRHAMDVLSSIEKGKPLFSHLRAFAFAALQHHHPETSLMQAGEVVPDFIKGAENVFVKLIVVSFPQDAEVEKRPGNRRAAKKQ